jgi:hypothetical protein
MFKPSASSRRTRSGSKPPSAWSPSEPLVAVAAEEVASAEERRKRIERGERVSLPGKVPTLKELGITQAHAEYARALHSLTPEQFERYLDFGARKVDYSRRDYARLRRFLRAEAKRRPASLTDRRVLPNRERTSIMPDDTTST